MVIKFALASHFQLSGDFHLIVVPHIKLEFSHFLIISIESNYACE